MSRFIAPVFSHVSKIATLGFAALALATAAANAHAHLSRAEPRVNSTVASAPQEVRLSFSEGLESVFSTIEVTDAKGERMDEGEPRISGSVMTVGLKPLAPGAYKVHWRALSVDTHKTEGTFMFKVAK